MVRSPSSHRGFTLIEVVLAIALLSLVLTMVAGLVITGIRVNAHNVQQMQALNIAEEGLEIVRNMRDGNWWQNVDFAGGSALWTHDLSAGLYRVSPDDTGTPWHLTAITNADTDSYLYENTMNGVSVLTDDPTGSLSLFRRFIDITDVDPTDGILDVTSTVVWNDRGEERSVILSTSLTNWKGGTL